MVSDISYTELNTPDLVKAHLVAAADDPKNLTPELQKAYMALLWQTRSGQARYNAEGHGETIHGSSRITDTELIPLKANTAADEEPTFAALKKGNSILSKIPPLERQAIIERLAEKVAENKEFFDTAVSLEVGKNGSEVGKLMEFFDMLTDPAMLGTISPEINFFDAKGKPVDSLDDAASVQYTDKRPRDNGILGVTAAGNYPLALGVNAVVYGLLAGCSVITKPTKFAMLWSFKFEDLLQESIAEWAEESKDTDLRDKILEKTKGGLDIANEAQVEEFSKDVFKVSLGYGIDYHSEVGTLVFTGSGRTAKNIKMARFETLLENDRPDMHMESEESGICPVIVTKKGLEEYEAKGKTAEGLGQECVAGATGNLGQRCTATSLILVEEGVNSAVVDEFKAGIQRFTDNPHLIGNPFKAGVEHGALFDSTIPAKMERAKNICIQHGVSLSEIIGGDVLGQNQAPEGGVFATPLSIDITEVYKAHSGKLPEELHKLVFEEEIFAAATFIIREVKDINQAIEMCNEIKMPLAAGCYASAEERKQFSEETNFGSVKANGNPKDQRPYGKHGSGQASGGGRDGGSTSAEQCMVSGTTVTMSKAEFIEHYLPNLRDDFGREGSKSWLGEQREGNIPALH